MKHWLMGFMAAAMTAVATPALAADHAESPASDADPAADIADVFIFHAPDKAGRLVGVISFGGRPAPRSRIDIALYCDPKVLYTFNIDRDGNNLPDVQVFARFGRDSRDNCGLQLSNVPGAGGTFDGPVGAVFSSSAGMRAFAGLADDPFFFDSQGFTATLATFNPSADEDATPKGSLQFASVLASPPFSSTRDSFGFRNVSTIVFEMDETAAAAGATQLRVWGTTSRLVE